MGVISETFLSQDVLSKVRSKSEKTKEDFLMLVRCSLWGNKCDMSISGGSAVK